MNLWRRASGALKDRQALLSASLSRRSSHRIPDLEAAVIKATNHDEHRVDYRNAQRVFAWIRASPISLKPLMWALSIRMEKTQSWVVALKGLILIHGVLCCKTPAVLRIKRLPFYLSNFSHSRSNHFSCDLMWGFNSFIRSYYTYLDRRWSLLYGQRRRFEDLGLAEHLAKLENLQSLLAILLKIRPAGGFMRVNLILEAMDCVVIEVFDVHTRICNVIAAVLDGIDSAKKAESLLAMKLLRKALIQREEIEEYFEFCNEFGVFNSLEMPQLQRIPEDEIRDLEVMLMKGVSERRSDDPENVAVNVENGDNGEEEKRGMKTVITNEWEVFEEDDVNWCNELVKIGEGNNESCDVRANSNPFEISWDCLPIVQVYKHDQVPDFITFY